MPSQEQSLHCHNLDHLEVPDAKRVKKSDSSVPAPADVHSLFPMKETVKDTVLAGRSSLLALAQGQDDRLMVLIGPCSVHDPKAAIDYARWLAPLARLHQNELC